jgi:glycosyltransferase involved in cell wall biosynthesis
MDTNKRLNAHLAFLGPCSPSRVVQLLDGNDSEAPNLRNDGSPVNVLIAKISRKVLRISVLTYSSQLSCAKVYKFQNITFYIIPLRKNSFWILDFYRIERKFILNILREISPDLLHAHWTYEYSLAAIKYDRKSIITVHDNPIKVFRLTPDVLRFMKMLMSFWVRLFGKQVTYIFVSKSLLTAWKKYYLFSGQSRVIPNLIGFNQISAEKSHSVIQFTSIGNGSKLKNVATILKVWHRLSQRYPNFILNLIGPDLGIGSKLWIDWHKQVGDTVIWHGYMLQPEIQQILIDSTFYLHFSYEESQGMAVAEAMLLGCLVCVSEGIPALRETTGERAVFLNIRSVDSTLKSLENLLADLTFQENLLNESIRHINSKFNAENTLNDLLLLYHSRLDLDFG